MNTNTLLYRRVSTNKQDTSLETQEQSALRYLAQHDGEMACDPQDERCVCEDNDTSGSIPFAERPGGRRLLAAIQGFGNQPGSIRHVIVAKLDRLGRNVADFLAVWQRLADCGVALHIADEGSKSFNLANKDDFVMLVIKMTLAEYELMSIRERTKQNLQTKFNAGLLTGNVPYGYSVLVEGAGLKVMCMNNAELRATASQHNTATWKAAIKTLVPNEREQEWIRFMHDSLLSGWTYKTIAAHLNVIAVPTKEPAGVSTGRSRDGAATVTNGQWKIGMVQSILNSKHTARLLQTSAPSTVSPQPSTAS